MTLATILSVCLLLPGLAAQPAGRLLPASSPASPQSQDSAATTQPQAPQPQSPEPTPPLPSANGQTNPTTPTKPPGKPRQHHKKAAPSNCSVAPTPLNPAVGNSAGSESPSGADAASAGTTNAVSPDAASTAPKPCPAPKKVVRNGGSAEPTVQLTGGTSAEQAVHQRSTEQLTAATELNLKKIAGQQLNPSQKEMVSQIKQFMAQSKTAVAAGDPERGHDLALKAHLLSDELVKP
jgi:hypothetical protein